jgi:hypothetical protein
MLMVGCAAGPNAAAYVTAQVRNCETADIAIDWEFDG